MRVSVVSRDKIVVLGSGWGGYKILSTFRDSRRQHSLTCISVNNHFLFTPLLSTTCVGTLEFRGICEPTMALKHVSFVHGEALSIDQQRKVVLCRSVHDVARSDDDNAERYYPEFEVAFDKLVIAVGARAATFGIPGVKEYTFPLRQLSDARAIRTRLINVFERAASPFCDDAERTRLLNFVIVGGGPTSVEFAAELYDFLQQDVRKLFPSLIPFCHVTLVEASSRVLGSFSSNLSDYVKKLYESRDFKLLLGKSVKEVHKHHLELIDGTMVRYGLCVWSTGNEMIPFVKRLPFVKEKRQPGRLVVDEYLRVLGSDCIYSVGDCAAEQAAPKPGTAQVAAQQGKWLAKHLSGASTAPFRYVHRGMLAYVGGMRALADLPIWRSSGVFGWLFWNSAYLTNSVSAKNKAMNALQWAKCRIWGRDVVTFDNTTSWRPAEAQPTEAERSTNSGAKQ